MWAKVDSGNRRIVSLCSRMKVSSCHINSTLKTAAGVDLVGGGRA